MEYNSVDEVVTDALIDYAKMRMNERDPKIRKMIDQYAKRVINDNITGLGAQKDFWVDYIIYTRTSTR